MRLVPMFLPTCPQWYELPEGEDIPDMFWFWGSPKPPRNISKADLSRAVPMDESHDYRLTATHFRFMYSGGEESWVILQYNEDVEDDLIRCPHCGEDIPIEANFCGYCGKKL